MCACVCVWGGGGGGGAYVKNRDQIRWNDTPYEWKLGRNKGRESNGGTK